LKDFLGTEWDHSQRRSAILFGMRAEEGRDDGIEPMQHVRRDTEIGVLVMPVGQATVEQEKTIVTGEIRSETVKAERSIEKPDVRIAVLETTDSSDQCGCTTIRTAL
jgi:hypothetical protein